MVLLPPEVEERPRMLEAVPGKRQEAAHEREWGLVEAGTAAMAVLAKEERREAELARARVLAALRERGSQVEG